MIIGITYYKNKATGLKCVDVVVPIIKSSADTSILIFTRPTDKYIRRRAALKNYRRTVNRWKRIMG